MIWYSPSINYSPALLIILHIPSPYQGITTSETEHIVTETQRSSSPLFVPSHLRDIHYSWQSNPWRGDLDLLHFHKGRCCLLHAPGPNPKPFRLVGVLSGIAGRCGWISKRYSNT